MQLCLLRFHLMLKYLPTFSLFFPSGQNATKLLITIRKMKFKYKMKLKTFINPKLQFVLLDVFLKVTFLWFLFNIYRTRVLLRIDRWEDCGLENKKMKCEAIFIIGAIVKSLLFSLVQYLLIFLSFSFHCL